MWFTQCMESEIEGITTLTIFLHYNLCRLSYLNPIQTSTSTTNSNLSCTSRTEQSQILLVSGKIGNLDWIISTYFKSSTSTAQKSINRFAGTRSGPSESLQPHHTEWSHSDQVANTIRLQPSFKIKLNQYSTRSQSSSRLQTSFISIAAIIRLASAISHHPTSQLHHGGPCPRSGSWFCWEYGEHNSREPPV